jgi:hypothetical protein
VFESFWDDYSASVKVPGMPKVLLHTLFGKSNNKFGYEACNMKSAQFKKEVEAIINAHRKKATDIKAGSCDSPLKNDLKQLDLQQARDKMKAVQEQMKTKVAEKRAKRKLELPSVTEE